MTKSSPDYKKRLVSIKGACVAPFSIKGDLVTLSGKVKKLCSEGGLSENERFLPGKPQ
jgi:hypothetical protein